MTKNEIIEFINSEDFEVYENEYPIILRMIEELDDRLFTKILEEILLGNLSWMDFEPIFNDKQFTNVLSNSLEKQKEFSDRYTAFIKYLNDLKALEKINDDMSLSMLVNVNKSVIDADKRNKIYSLFLTNNRNPLHTLYRNAFISDLLKNDNRCVSFRISKTDTLINGIYSQPNERNNAPIITISNNYWVVDGLTTNIKVENLTIGKEKGVAGIELILSEPLKNTYTLTFVDGNKLNFYVTKDASGVLKTITSDTNSSGNKPKIKITENRTWSVDNIDTRISVDIPNIPSEFPIRRVLRIRLIDESNPNDLLYELHFQDDNNVNFSIENMLLSVDDYIVPVDYQYVQLDDTDLEYGRLHNISSDELRKAKSLALYFNNIYNDVL